MPHAAPRHGPARRRRWHAPGGLARPDGDGASIALIDTGCGLAPVSGLILEAPHDIWLHPEFRNWNIEEHLPGIRCPVLVIQGEDDEYGTSKQIEAIGAQVSGEFESVLLAECGHAPHIDQPTITEDTIVRFVNTRVLATPSSPRLYITP